MLFKVVIVEDNPLTVRSLRQTIDWAALGCEVTGTATDGESGARLILQQRPDLVLTDIRMPQKSGLEMIEDVRRELPDCKVIIITGYDQFQYASRAIKLSVFDYLLKPIDNAEVIGAVRRAVAMTSRQLETDVALEQVAALKRRAQLLSLITNDSQKGQGVQGMLSDAGLSFETYYVMAVQQRDENVYSQAFLNRLDAVLARDGVWAVTLLIYDSAVVFVMRDDAGEGWQEQATSLSAEIAEELVTPVRVGVSELGCSRHAIRQAYLQARQALWEAALNKRPRPCFFYQEGDSGVPHIGEAHQQIDELVEKTDLSDASAAEAAHKLAEQSGRQYSNLRAMLFSYSMALRKRFAPAMNERIDTALGTAWFASNEEDVRQCLLNVFAALRDNLAVPRQSLLTRNALQYINLHAIEGLRLNDVADKLCVSANYLSALIRKETGVTFHEHMLEAKMNVARTMLADPRVLVEEVAHAVGYGNYISFYNAFKRAEHMTPTEYRNKKASL